MEIREPTAPLMMLKDIVEVYRSPVSRWTMYTNGREVKARYEDLTVAEHWINGDPWMIVETFVEHLDYLLVSNH